MDIRKCAEIQSEECSHMNGESSAIYDWSVSPLQIEELTRRGQEYAKIGQIPGREWVSG
jgi:hypothetical protein